MSRDLATIHPGDQHITNQTRGNIGGVGWQLKKMEKLTISAGRSSEADTQDVELIAESPDVFSRPSELSTRSSTSTVGTTSASNTGGLSAYKLITWTSLITGIWEIVTAKNVKCNNDYSVQNDKSLCRHCTTERRVWKRDIKVRRDVI